MIRIKFKQLQDETVMVYDALVYCMFLKRKIRVAFCQFLTHDFRVSSYKIYACTDLLLPALLIQQYYKARFQQEFLIRDAKQFTGLQDCQARSVNKLDRAGGPVPLEHFFDNNQYCQV